jgi:hypothetical protein
MTLSLICRLLVSVILGFSNLGGIAQTTVISDDFTDGQAAGGSDANGGNWLAASSSTVSVLDDAEGLASGNAMEMVSSGNFSRLTVEFPAKVSLSATGDQLTVSMRVRMTRASVDNDGGFRIGLHDHNGSPVTAANEASGWSTLTDAWSGYYFRAGVGTAEGMRIYQDTADRGDNALGGSGDITVGSGTNWALTTTRNRAIKIEVERLANGQHNLRYTVDGVIFQETSTAIVGGAQTGFTNFTIGSGSTELDLRIDDVIVTTDSTGGPVQEAIDLAARLIDWTRAGVEGGVVTYSSEVNFLTKGGDSSGFLDNSVILQNLLNGLSEDTVINFPAGTYLFNRRILLNEGTSKDLPGVIIRGAGTDSTKFIFSDPNTDGLGLFNVTGIAKGSPISITGGLTKGSTSITLSTVGGVVAGDWIYIEQDNDFTAMATTRDISDYLTTIDNSSGWARRTVGQVVKVSAVNGAALTLDRALHLDFTWANPTATVAKMASGIGFEDFTIEDGAGAANRINFNFVRSVNSWVKNVHSVMAVRYHLRTDLSANLTVRDSFFDDAHRHDGGGHGYGTLIGGATTHTLIENNVYRRLRHAMIWKEGANGNVFAYNYSFDGIQDGSVVAKDISGHGHYAFGNLIEGNVAEFIHVSDFWGPIGPNNVFLRNRTTKERILIEDRTVNQVIAGNELVSPTSPFIAIDATSTGAYVHGNNEGGTLQWRTGEAQTVVNSYFYSRQPTYWNISDPWPSMGPEYTAGTNTIPAKNRWDNNQMNFFADVTAGRLSNLSTRGYVATGSDILVAGFVIAGTEPRTVLMRGVGPTLGDFIGQESVIENPKITLFSGTTEIGSNEDWESQSGAAAVASLSQTLGAFPLGAASKDAALSATLEPGAYSVHVAGTSGTGVALVELYEGSAAGDSRLSNISTRGTVGSGNSIMVPGIVVTEGERQLLIRAVGPELATSFGFAKGDVLPNPVLTLLDGSQNVIATNDDWEDTGAAAAIVATAQTVGAFPLTSGGADAVLLVTVPAGTYTAQVQDASGQEGVAIVEIYEVP